MNCAEVRDLLPAYVLGALDSDEIDAVEAHLKIGHEHDDELVELRATVFAMDRFADERSLEATDAPTTSWPTRLLRRTGPAEPASPPGFMPSWKFALAAVLVLAVFASGWFVARMNSGGGGQTVAVSVQGQGGQLVSLKGASSQDGVYVVMSGLERLPTDRVYQIWAIRNGQWLRIGVCNPDASGHWEGEFRFRLAPAEQIAVTIEPAGGSDRPTSPPLLTSAS